jgi:AraC-like DNA-binding protein
LGDNQMNQADFSTVRYSAADLPEKDRIAKWREHYARVAMKTDIEPAQETSFEYAITVRALPGVQLVSAVMSPFRVVRTRELLADGNDNLALFVNQSGAFTASARGCEVALREGDAVLISSGHVSTFERHSHGSSLSFWIPRSILSSIVVDVENAMMQLVPREAGELKLLTGYAAPLLDEIDLATPEFRRVAVNHMHDLVGLALGATRDAAGVAAVRGLPAARLRLAKAHIMENSHRRELSVGAVATHLGLTPRNLQRLFENDGTTFSEFLLGQRLSRAHRMLTEPRLAQCAIGAIAYDSGFGDLSYFNRSFKQRFGATPREVRNCDETSERVVAKSVSGC